jgi:hypothetical protein
MFVHRPGEVKFLTIGGNAAFEATQAGFVELLAVGIQGLVVAAGAAPGFDPLRILLLLG